MRKTNILILLIITLILNSCHVGRFFVYNFADMKDYKKFPQIELSKSDTPFKFKEDLDDKHLTDITFPERLMQDKEINSWDLLFEETKTLSFIIIKDDNILFERYSSGEMDEMYTSFSVAKSYISALIGIAIDEGKIKSVDEPITNYLDFFKNEGFEKITIEHLLNMESGIDFNENYFNPFGEVGQYYYGLNLKKYVTKLKIKEEPGKNYEYISVNTLLLGMIVEKATGMKVYEYLDEKIWKPLGMEFEATINVDSKKNDMTKSFCCINARSRDYAKFGRLYLNNGNWNGTQVISEEWVRKSTEYRKEATSSYYYQYQWRIGKSGGYFAQGLLGQFIYINPKKNIIIVRNAKKNGINNWLSIFDYIAKKI
jgi:CubicO group peptidase (beta-lactamase class C family)